MTLLSVQVFGEGTDAVKRSLEGIFDDTVPDGKVKVNTSSLWVTQGHQRVHSAAIWGKLNFSTPSMKT